MPQSKQAFLGTGGFSHRRGKQTCFIRGRSKKAQATKKPLLSMLRATCEQPIATETECNVSLRGNASEVASSCTGCTELRPCEITFDVLLTVLFRFGLADDLRCFPKPPCYPCRIIEIASCRLILRLGVTGPEGKSALVTVRRRISLSTEKSFSRSVLSRARELTPSAIGEVCRGEGVPLAATCIRT
jgi:hypothetical protein